MATFASNLFRVQEKPQQFGKMVILKVYDSVPKDDERRKTIFMRAKFSAESFQGKDALKLDKGDEVFIAGRFEIEKWQKGDGEDMVFQFPDIRVPWYVIERSRGEETKPTPAKAEPIKAKAAAARRGKPVPETTDDGLDDIPF